MTKLLTKMFVMDYDNTTDSTVRTRYGNLASVIGIICNLILFSIKLIIGILLKSVTITADSFNNLTDSASSIVTMIGFKISSKPADKEHPFGHGRSEYISSLIISLIIILLGYEFLKSSVDKIMNPTMVHFDTAAIVILLIGILLKVWLSVFNYKIGKTIHSSALIATSIDARNDVIISAVTILSIVISFFTGIHVDGIAGTIVAIFLLYSGVNIAKETLSELLGKSADPELAKTLKEEICAYDGIIGVHELIIHDYGPNKIMATIHAEVPDNVPIEISHEVIDLAERELSEKYHMFLLMHMDPIAIKDERIQSLFELVNNKLKLYSENISAHDFRIVDGINSINLLFDMVVPHELTHDQTSELVKDIQREVHNLDQRYNCVINVETGYISY